MWSTSRSTPLATRTSVRSLLGLADKVIDTVKAGQIWKRLDSLLERFNLDQALCCCLFCQWLIPYLRVPVLKETGIAIVRMTLQLLFVGFYFQVIFRLNNPWMNLALVAVEFMTVIATDLLVLTGLDHERIPSYNFLLETKIDKNLSGPPKQAA